MRRIIKNKVYDTSTAQEMGTYKNPEGNGNFYGYEYTLYRKKTGEFFVHACGGPDSQESIIPFAYDEAQEWAKELLTEEQYKDIFFGVADENADTEALTVQLPTPLVIQLKRRTDKSGRLIKEAVAEALQQWLKKQEA